jgi:hypothetical protein
MIKAVAVMFPPDARERTVNLTLRGADFKIENSARFLGVIFDSRLTWRQDIEYM